MAHLSISSSAADQIRVVLAERGHGLGGDLDGRLRLLERDRLLAALDAAKIALVGFDGAVDLAFDEDGRLTEQQI